MDVILNQIFVNQSYSARFLILKLWGYSVDHFRRKGHLTDILPFVLYEPGCLKVREKKHATTSSCPYWIYSIDPIPSVVAPPLTHSHVHQDQPPAWPQHPLELGEHGAEILLRQ